MRRILRRLLLAPLLIYLGLCVALFAFQDRLVWFPGPPPATDPAARGWPFEAVTLQAADGPELDAWFLPVVEPVGCVLICHGNAGSIADRLHLAGAWRDAGFSVLLYDYRGYGRSSGTPSEAGTYADGEAAWRFLREVRGFEADRIVLSGESLGCAVALELATRHSPAAVVIESAFVSVPVMASELYPWLPVRWLVRIRYANDEKVARIDAPLLVVHSPEDELVPFTHAERLFALAHEPKELLRTGGGHNGGGFTRRADWRRRVAAFARSAVGAAD